MQILEVGERFDALEQYPSVVVSDFPLGPEMSAIFFLSWEQNVKWQDP